MAAADADDAGVPKRRANLLGETVQNTGAARAPRACVCVFLRSGDVKKLLSAPADVVREAAEIAEENMEDGEDEWRLEEHFFATRGDGLPVCS